jgi:O-antigen/teichoic acid export membrane protein
MSEVKVSSSLNNLAVRSAKWALIARISQVLGGSVTLILLPFWLLPAQYGIISMFSSVLALVMILQQAGLMETIIQRESDAESIRDAAFWISILVSVVLYAIVYAFAPIICIFFNSSELLLPLRVGSLQILFIGISNIPLGWLQRKFRYRPYALVQVISSIFFIFVSIILSILGEGYWAYIAGILCSSVIRLFMALLFMDWRPKIKYDLKLWKQIFKFGIYVLFEMILGWFFIWFDNVVVAKNLGSDAVGVYALTFNITTMVISLPCSAITGVTLPTFSRMQSDAITLRNIYLKGTKLIAAYAIPACIGLALVGSILGDLVYPGRWNGLQSIISILALYSGFSYLWILNTDAFKAVGKPEIMVKIYIPVVIFMIPVYWVTSRIGLLEFVIARSLIVFVGSIPHTYYAIKILGLEKNYLYKVIRSPLVASIIMALVVWVGLKLLPNIQLLGARETLLFVSGIVFIGAGIYFLTLRIIDPELTQQFTRLIIHSAKTTKSI